jgi:hypothetical protein
MKLRAQTWSTIWYYAWRIGVTITLLWMLRDCI